MKKINQQIKEEQIKEQIKVMATALPVLGGYLKLDANNINILVNDLYTDYSLYKWKKMNVQETTSEYIFNLLSAYKKIDQKIEEQI